MFTLWSIFAVFMLVFHARSDEGSNLTTGGYETANGSADTSKHFHLNDRDVINSETTEAANVINIDSVTINSDSNAVPVTIETDVLSNETVQDAAVTAPGDTDQETDAATGEGNDVTEKQPKPATAKKITEKITPKKITKAPKIPDQDSNTTDTGEGDWFDNQTTQEIDSHVIFTPEPPGEGETEDILWTLPGEIGPNLPRPPSPYKVPDCTRTQFLSQESEKEKDDCSVKGTQRFLLLLNGVERDITESACVIPVYAKTTDVNLKLCVTQSRAQYSLELSGDDMHYTFVPKKDFCAAFTFSVSDIKTMKYVKFVYTEIEEYEGSNLTTGGYETANGSADTSKGGHCLIGNIFISVNMFV